MLVNHKSFEFLTSEYLRRDHVSEVLMNLHWLPVQTHIQFTLHASVHGDQRDHDLTDMIRPVAHHLRSTTYPPPLSRNS